MAEEKDLAQTEGKTEENTEKKNENIEKESEKSTKSISESLGEEKNSVSGLEELPEEILKKLEKKKSEREQMKSKSKSKKKKKKAPRRVSTGKAFVKATYNNTIVTLTDIQGNVLSWASAGVAGFKGPKKSTPYAAQIITRLAVGKAREEFGLQEVAVFVKGVGTGRESAIRALNSNGLIVTSIKDMTPVPHNGCRPKKPRRV